jgi:hypothetical protein
MRYYFAGAFARYAELVECRSRLYMVLPRAVVSSRWLDLHEGEVMSIGLGTDDLGNPAEAWKYGFADLEDLSGSDAIVSFTGQGERGGRHIEHGYAIALHESDDPRVYRPRLIVVGPREHIFHCHPATEVYADFDAFLRHEVDRA